MHKLYSSSKQARLSLFNELGGTSSSTVPLDDEWTLQAPPTDSNTRAYRYYLNATQSIKHLWLDPLVLPLPVSPQAALQLCQGNTETEPEPKLTHCL